MTDEPSELDLRRWPPTKNRSLRAIDAADRLALAHAADRWRPGARVLAVNDGFGALAVSAALAGGVVTTWTDSALAAEAVRRNARRNRAGDIAVLPSTTPPTGSFDVVLVKIPKNLAFLRSQLTQLRAVIGASTSVIGAGMVKHLPRRAIELFDEVIGPTTTSLAKQKARLILPTLDLDRSVEDADPISYRSDGGVECVNWPNVFSHGKLDIGTRLLLEHMPTVVPGGRVLDLGCGNGVLGVTAALDPSVGSVTFCDVSWSAIASAEATWAANLGADDRSTFMVGDLAGEIADVSVDVVLLNPPFHDDHVVGDETALRLFDDAWRVLRPGGELRVVANRHLGYHRRLERRFSNVEVVASNPKFVVLSASRR